MRRRRRRTRRSQPLRTSSMRTRSNSRSTAPASCSTTPSTRRKRASSPQRTRKALPRPRAPRRRASIRRATRITTNRIRFIRAATQPPTAAATRRWKAPRRPRVRERTAPSLRTCAPTTSFPRATTSRTSNRFPIISSNCAARTKISSSANLPTSTSRRRLQISPKIR